MSYQAPPPQQPYGQPMAAAKPQKTVVSILAAIFQIILAIYGGCISALTIVLGALFGGLGSASSQIFDQAAATAAASGASTEDIQAASEFVQTASGAAGAIGFLGVAIGILLLVLAVAALVVAIGIFIDKPWAYVGTIVVLGVYIAAQLLFDLVVLQNLGILTIIIVILAGILLYFFLTDDNVKRQFGRA